MDDKDVGKFWDENAENWTKLARMGYDVCRNCVNSPEFFKLLPDVTGLKGLDIGCGEGYNTRITAKKGSEMTAIDISEVFIKHAIEKEKEEPLGIKYQVASAVELPFENESFDFIISTMAFMDMFEIDKAFKEAYRVLKPNGFFQISIISYVPHIFAKIVIPSGVKSFMIKSQINTPFSYRYSSISSTFSFVPRANDIHISKLLFSDNVSDTLNKGTSVDSKSSFKYPGDNFEKVRFLINTPEQLLSNNKPSIEFSAILILSCNRHLLLLSPILEPYKI